MNKIKIFLVAAALLLSGQSFAQTTKATIQGEISSSTANGLLGGTILNNIVLSYVDWTTCSGTGGIVYWNAGIPTCLNAGTNGYTLTMVSGIPQWTLPASQSANTVYAGPSSGSPATPSFRALVGSDLPNPSASTLGGVQSAAAVSHQWINSISTSGVPQLSQPAFTDISGTLGVSTGGTGATSAANAIINLMPTPTRAGDVAYWNGTNWVTLPGNNSSTQYLAENASGVPSWSSSSSSGVTSVNTLTGALSITAGTGIAVVPSGSTIQVSVNGNIIITPKQYNGSGSTSSTTGTISASSPTLTLGSAIDFQNGEGIRINGAGPSPTIGAATSFTATPTGTTGSTSYTYYVEALDATGGVKAAASATFSNGAAQLISGTSTVSLAWTAGSGSPSAYAILVKCTSCVQYTSSPQLIAIVNTTSFIDTGSRVDGSLTLAWPDWLPQTNLTSDQADWLVTTVNSGGGSTTLTLAAASTNAVSSPGYNNVLHDDTASIQSAINAAQTAHGQVYLIGISGNLFRTTSALTITSHIIVYGDGDQSITDICLMACRNVTLSDISNSTTILPYFLSNAINKTTSDAVELHHFGIVYLQPTMPNSGTTAYAFQGTNAALYCKHDSVHDMLFVQADRLISATNCTSFSISNNVLYNFQSSGIYIGKGTGSDDWWINQNVLLSGQGTQSNSSFIWITASAAPHIIGNKINANVGGITSSVGVHINPQYNGTSVEPPDISNNSIEGNVTGIQMYNSCSAAANGAIATTGTLVGGSGGAFGTYNNVHFTGGTGTDAYGSVIVNSSGAVSAVNMFVTGYGYVSGDVLSASSGSIGGVSGFSFHVASIASACGIYQGLISANQIWANTDINVVDGVSTNFWNGATISGNIMNTVGGGGVYNVILGASSAKSLLFASNTFSNTSGSGSTSWYDGGGNSGIKFSNNFAPPGINQSIGTTSMAGLSCGGTVTNNNDNAVQASFYPTSGSGITSFSRNGATLITQGSAVSPAFTIPLMPGDTMSVACGTVPAVSYFALNP